MSTEKDLLEIYKERIKQESNYGDKAEALRRTGIAPSTYDAGIKKIKYVKLNTKERLAIEALIEILDERKQEYRERKQEYERKLLRNAIS